MRVLLMQLPIPQLDYGKQTGNIPFGAACLKLAAEQASECRIEIVPESVSSYLADAALIDTILAKSPDILGFTVFSWNLERSLFIAERVKKLRNVKIVFGGPEITPDNPFLNPKLVDFHVFGEGEAVFSRLLEHPGFWLEKRASMSAESIFLQAKNPYLCGLLEPEIEDLVLIETQRGCPYRCGYCHYNKSRDRVSAAPARPVLDVIRWARTQNISEAFLLDPSLDARRDLPDLLDGIARINPNRQLSLLSEIRAEAIDSNMAEKFAGAGFTEFEIGLQSLTEKAQILMNRRVNAKKFLSGVKCLQSVGIRPKIDLIIGLPGDDLPGFKTSVDFVADNLMHDDVQVFFLSVLPGTDFRRKSRELGLEYEPRPPYTVVETETFNRDDMLAAFVYAEERFDVSLEPSPDLDLSHRGDSDTFAIYADIINGINTDGRPYIRKIVLDKEYPVRELEQTARHLTHPYQIVFQPQLKNRRFMLETVKIMTSVNPHTPLEIVFIDPTEIPDTAVFESALKLRRPLWLDLDAPAYGLRSVLFSVAIPETGPIFGGTMKRQIFLWKHSRLPERDDLECLIHLGGILIDSDSEAAGLEEWQDGFAKNADDLPLVSFADTHMQRRWERAVQYGALPLGNP